MMRQFLLGGLVTLAIAGCEADLRTGSTLEPTAVPGTYRWRSIIDPVYTDDSSRWEAARLRQLDKVVGYNGICPAGYTVTDRRVTIKNEALLGAAGDVFYTIKCK